MTTTYDKVHRPDHVVLIRLKDAEYHKYHDWVSVEITNKILTVYVKYESSTVSDVYIYPMTAIVNFSICIP